MKTLLILRHAKSSWKQEGLDDHERPLSKRGLKNAPRVGALLKEQGLVPDLILSSSARRARETAELVAEGCDYAGEVSGGRDLYSFDYKAYLEALIKVSDEHDRVMVVGHNPGLEELLQQLTGEFARLPTAAVAVVQLPIHRWAELQEGVQGELLKVFRPKEF